MLIGGDQHHAVMLSGLTKSGSNSVSPLTHLIGAHMLHSSGGSRGGIALQIQEHGLLHRQGIDVALGLHEGTDGLTADLGAEPADKGRQLALPDTGCHGGHGGFQGLLLCGVDVHAVIPHGLGCKVGSVGLLYLLAAGVAGHQLTAVQQALHSQTGFFLHGVAHSFLSYRYIISAIS